MPWIYTYGSVAGMPRAVLALLAALTGWGQSFEVATVKPASFPSEAYFKGFTSGGPCGRVQVTISGNRATLQKANVCSLIRAAYDIEDYRVLDVPQWILSKDPSTYYDVQAQAADSVQLTPDSVRPMLQTLLAERFHLRFHREQRETPVYALVVGKNGHKLSTEPLKTCEGKMPKLELRGTGSGSCMPIETMTQLAYDLSHEADRPVIDKTGLTEKYAYFYLYSPENAPILPNSAPSLFTAIQEQLGLKLEPQKTIFDVIVIDSAERPTEN